MITLYTDGACSNNQVKEKSIGGWAYHLSYLSYEKTDKGRVLETTNIRMEMIAVIKGLQAIKDASKSVTVYTDSQLVVETINSGWKRKANIDLWTELDNELKRFRDIKFVHVKGHNGNKYNELVDRLAVEMTR